MNKDQLIANIVAQSNTLSQQLNQKKWHDSQAAMGGIIQDFQKSVNTFSEMSLYYTQGLLHQLNHKIAQPNMKDSLFLFEMNKLGELFKYNLNLQSKLKECNPTVALDDADKEIQRKLFIDTNEAVKNTIENDKRLLSIEMLENENTRLRELLEKVYKCKDLPEAPTVEAEDRAKIRNDKPKQAKNTPKSNFSIIDAMINFLSDVKKPNFNPASSIKNLVGGLMGFLFDLFSNLIQGMFGAKVANQFSGTAQNVLGAMTTQTQQATPPKTKPAPKLNPTGPAFTPAFNGAKGDGDREDLENQPEEAKPKKKVRFQVPD